MAAQLRALEHPYSAKSLLKWGALTIAGSLLLTLFAKVQVPLYPVPITLQTLALYLIALSCTPHLTLSIVLLYLIEGAFGFPVFAATPEKGIGLAYMMGPTGGYLAGFLLAGGVVSYLSKKIKSTIQLIPLLMLGNILIYIPGALWLAQFVGIENTIPLGIVPFLIGDGLKIILAVTLVAAGKPLVAKFKQ